MATYIQHPALMGAQMADEMSRQRINEVGAAIAQRQQDIARAEERDAAALYNALDTYTKIASDPTKNLYAAMPGISATIGQGQQNALQRLGINPNFLPGQPGYRTGPSRYTAGMGAIPNITATGNEFIVGQGPARKRATLGDLFQSGRTQLTPEQADWMLTQGGGPDVLSQFYQWQQNTPPPPPQIPSRR